MLLHILHLPKEMQKIIQFVLTVRNFSISGILKVRILNANWKTEIFAWSNPTKPEMPKIFGNHLLSIQEESVVAL
jgi:hypothetical protein